MPRRRKSQRAIENNTETVWANARRQPAKALRGKMRANRMTGARARANPVQSAQGFHALIMPEERLKRMEKRGQWT